MKTFKVTQRQKEILQKFIDVSLVYPNFTFHKRMQLSAKQLGVAENGYAQTFRNTIKAMGISEKELIMGYQNIYTLEVPDLETRHRTNLNNVYEDYISGMSIEQLTVKYDKSIDRIQQIVNRKEAEFHKIEREKKLDTQIKKNENPSIAPILAFSPDGKKSYQKPKN